MADASKEHLNSATSGLGRVKEGAKSSSEVPPVIGKYTYCRKKLSQKELIFSKSVAENDSRTGKQLVTKLRKHVSGDVGEAAEVKIASAKHGKTKMIKGKKDTTSKGKSSVSVNSSSHNDQLSLKNKAGQKVLKFSGEVQSIFPS